MAEKFDELDETNENFALENLRCLFENLIDKRQRVKLQQDFGASNSTGTRKILNCRKMKRASERQFNIIIPLKNC